MGYRTTVKIAKNGRREDTEPEEDIGLTNATCRRTAVEKNSSHMLISHSFWENKSNGGEAETFSYRNFTSVCGK